MPDIFINPKEGKIEQKPEDIVEEKAVFQETVTEAPKSKEVLEQLPGHSHNPLSSFIYFPEKVNFESQESEEKVILLLRRHAITNIGWVLVTALLFFVPAVAKALGLLAMLPGNYQFFIHVAWYIFVFTYAMQGFLGWYYNVHIITDERIVDVNFSNLIYKQVSDASINKIQDVTYKMGGVARTMFNYGDVVVQTASEVPNFNLEAVSDPNRVAKILQDLRHAEEHEGQEGTK
jgi:membrane protein YdbS with pleckstrin-like domain